MPIHQSAGGPAPQPTNPVLPKVTTSQVVVKQDVSQPGETTFADLSRRFYGSDRYAAALQEYNRGQTNPDPAIKQNLTQLPPGTRVAHPPKELLESGFADHLTSSGSPAPAASAPPIVRISAPQALTNPAPTPAPIGSPSPVAVRSAGPPSTDVTKSYRVPPQGLMILQIARDTLGDGNRWPEIYRLNPNLQPQFPIPGGTEIRLPASANVP
jgi:nucleoid-associated protein YgaU